MASEEKRYHRIFLRPIENLGPRHQILPVVSRRISAVFAKAEPIFKHARIA